MTVVMCKRCGEVFRVWARHNRCACTRTTAWLAGRQIVTQGPAVVIGMADDTIGRATSEAARGKDDPGSLVVGAWVYARNDRRVTREEA